MVPGRLQAIEEIFHAALACEPDQVNALLEIKCAGDERLRTKIETLLAAHRDAASSVETSIAAVAVNLIENRQRRSLIGQTIGHYKILKQIGAGGMGEVYLACDITVGRNAALKVLPAYVSDNTARLKRFEREARSVASLNHPNIMTIYELGDDDATRYIAGELIEGETLYQRLTRGRIELIEAIEIAIQITSALAAAHSAGVVHRDVKPDNIMLRPDGYVKVLDFGIAKLVESAFAEAIAERQESLKLAETNLGAILGTVSYMSPEQTRAEAIDKRTDIWSLGIVVYQMITGQAPFTGDTPREITSSIVEKEPPPLSRYLEHDPPELQQILTKALQKNPEERYQNANEMLEALNVFHHQLKFAAELAQSQPQHPWLQRMRSPAGLAFTAVLFALLLASGFYVQYRLRTSAPEKSVAVLPFENVADDKQNSYFADGLQDQLLADIARVADLKVISRTSVMQYKTGEPRNLRAIARQLGVDNLVQGSVQRSGNRVRVNAELINAHTERQLWGQTYDRELSDIFTIEDEIAKAIASRLRVKLSPAERQAIERVPTRDVAAFDLYTRAKNLVLETTLSSNAKADLLQATELLNQAVARDPTFFEAHCELAYTNDSLYFSGYDHTSARLRLAEAAIQAALHLRPDAGEMHVAQAWHLYSAYLDYDGALAELERARQKLPNNPRIFQLKGFIQRRQGTWEESTRNLERAITLDPRNVYTLHQIALSYDYLRRYADEKSVLDRVLAIMPDDIDTKVGRAWVEVSWHANTRPLHQIIDSIRSTTPAAVSRIADAWLFCALSERDAGSARDALMFAEEKPHVSTDNVALSRLFLQGVIARMTNHNEEARVAFTAARAEQEKAVQAQPTYGPAMCLLGLIDAGLGGKKKRYAKQCGQSSFFR